MEVKPELIRRVDPVYPYYLTDKDGFVILKILVDTAGRATKAEPLVLSDSIFLKFAIEASKQSVFSPAYKDGRKVEAYIEIPFRFTKTGREYPRGIPENLPGCSAKYILHIGKWGTVIEAEKIEGDCEISLDELKKFKFGRSMRDYWLLLITGEVKDGNIKKNP